MSKSKNTKISDFFKKASQGEDRDTDKRDNEEVEASIPNPERDNTDTEKRDEEDPPSKVRRTLEANELYLERDPALRKPIWEYETENKRNEIRKAYLQKGPHTLISNYPSDDNGRRFHSSWFKQFPGWLEYSSITDAAYCLPCFLYATPNNRFRHNAFTKSGFRSWKKVNEGEKCTFLTHMGKGPNSAHKTAVKKCNDLINMEQHIDTLIDNINPELVERNRLRLKVFIFVVRWLTFQHCALRGHDESVGSLNRGNFIEFLRAIAYFSKDVESVVLENAPGNASYTSSDIQKEILAIYASKIRDVIRKEIGDHKFCIIVDETKDISKREQMTVVLRFVDKNGYLQERLFDLIHVPETNALTLKIAIEKCLSAHNLRIQNIRGQGYDGGSNMRGEWCGLQALFLNECPYAYYVHCFAHRLQLALVAASHYVIPVSQFFSKLTVIVNIVTSSSKRHDQLQSARLEEIHELIELEEMETGKGQNQVGTIKRAGDTRWGSHLDSLTSLLRMYEAARSVLKIIIKDGKGTQRAEADTAYDDMTSFEFVVILHIMIEILGITNDLCRALQRKSQDILNAMNLVSKTKVPDLEAHYARGRGRPKSSVTNSQYFRVDVFIAVIDSQKEELNHRFKEDMIELLSLSTSLDPKGNFQNFKVDNIIKLVTKFYPTHFTDQEKLALRCQSELFFMEVKDHPELQNVTLITDLCQWLAKTEKAEIYYLIDRLIRLVLTLPVSTASAERAFSAMKLIKTTLRNRMEDDYLTDSLILYVEKAIAKNFDIDSIVDAFASVQGRRALMKISKSNA